MTAGQIKLARQTLRVAKGFGRRALNVRKLSANPSMSRRSFLKLSLATGVSAMNNLAQNSRAMRGIYNPNGLRLLGVAARKRRSRLMRSFLGVAGNIMGMAGA